MRLFINNNMYECIKTGTYIYKETCNIKLLSSDPTQLYNDFQVGSFQIQLVDDDDTTISEYEGYTEITSVILYHNYVIGMERLDDGTYVMKYGDVVIVNAKKGG